MSVPDKFSGFVWHFVKKQKKGFLILILTSLVTAVSGTIWPQVTGSLVDTLSDASKYSENIAEVAKKTFLTVIGFWFFIEALSRSRGYVYSCVMPKLEVSIREHMFRHVSLHSHAYFSKNFIGSIANRLADLPKGTSLILDIIFTDMLPVLVGMVIASTLFITMQPILATIMSLWLITHVLVCIFSSKRAAKLSKLQFEARSLLQGKIVDALNNHLSIRIFNSYDYEAEYISTIQKDEQKKHKKSLLFIEKVKLSLSLLDLFGMGFLFAFALYFWSKSIITTGDVVAVVTTSLNLMALIVQASDEMTYLFREIGLCQQGLQLIKDPIEIKESPNAKEIKSLNDGIQFKEISFSYGDGKNIFKDISLEIKKGESVAFVGYSGSGKTTFVNLIPRFFDPTSGAICIDGKNIKDLKIGSLRRLVSLVPQDPVLFHRSIAENIRYSNQNATEEQIINAAKLAQCHDFVIASPFGYQTDVGERGSKLSGGERQRVMIARAILSDAPIVIMDEATSALDAKNSNLIQKAIASVKERKTLLIISHNLPSITPFVDKVVVFNNKSIVEEGTHAELITKKGIYSNIWESSFVSL